jgi:hypothetical protein
MSIGQLENKYNEWIVYCNFQSSTDTGMHYIKHIDL